MLLFIDWCFVRFAVVLVGVPYRYTFVLIVFFTVVTGVC